MATLELHYLRQLPVSPSSVSRIHTIISQRDGDNLLRGALLASKSDTTALLSISLYQNGLSARQYPGSRLGGQSWQSFITSFMPIY